MCRFQLHKITLIKEIMFDDVFVTFEHTHLKLKMYDNYPGILYFCDDIKIV